eukprot:CAMPEP_0172181794 /NCGR_PEP_ID=MMETSP1050-20130122/18026_1 /TAXON_ID=233186 /ORGANISM="Cryptomonas curvata, Strain CCAP979/52" /LENGTH=66 /DNA_ID=CAMNT_0012855137 /DNA_START=116 /DNA_END=316 /DNA_ORIENTATION=-
MFAILCQFSKLDEANAFEKDQGRAQWPDISTYSRHPKFDVKSFTESDNFTVDSGSADGSYTPGLNA